MGMAEEVPHDPLPGCVRFPRDPQSVVANCRIGRRRMAAELCHTLFSYIIYHNIIYIYNYIYINYLYIERERERIIYI